MEKTMILKAVSALRSREFPDKQTGEMRKVCWVDLTLSDGIDTMVGELTVPPQRDASGRPVYEPPQLQLDVVCMVSAEIDGTTGKKDGREWSSNRIRIRKIVQL